MFPLTAHKVLEGRDYAVFSIRLPTTHRAVSGHVAGGSRHLLNWTKHKAWDKGNNTRLFMPKWRWECRECFSLKKESQRLTWKQAESLEKWVPKAMYKELMPGVAPMRGSLPAILWDSAAAEQMGVSVAQSHCCWTGERGQAPKERIFLPCVRLKRNFSLEITTTIPTQLDVSFGAHSGKGRV